MVSNLQSRWAVAGSTFILWAVVAASTVYWSLKLTGGSAGVNAPVPVRNPPAADPALMARLLGSSPAVTVAAPVASLGSRFSLVGVVAGRNDTTSAALIAIDGKPPKPFKVGAAVEEGLVLQSVQARRAVLAGSVEGPPMLTLELPPPRK